MSLPRLIDEENLSFYHVIIRIPDRTHKQDLYSLERADKARLRELFFELESIYALNCVNYCIMSTHAHFILRREPDAEKKISLRGAALRYQRFYKSSKTPDARTQEVREFRAKLNNMSAFIGVLENRFTRWFNRTRPQDKKRVGSLWNPRYKSVLLKGHKALFTCLHYVELNAIRARMVENAADYEFCSWSEIRRKTKRGRRLRAGIISALREAGAGINESNARLWKSYALTLELLREGLKLNPRLKKLNPYLELILLQHSHLWSHGRILDFEDG